MNLTTTITKKTTKKKTTKKKKPAVLLRRARKPKLTDEQIAALPLSALLRLAVNDAKAAKAAGYRLYMYGWHVPSEREDGTLQTCSVCLAGAVLAETCGEPPRKVINADSHALEPRDRFLFAINSMRSGYFVDAAMNLERTLTEEQTDICRGVSEYLVTQPFCEGRFSFAAYLRAARMLEKGGL